MTTPLYDGGFAIGAGEPPSVAWLTSTFTPRPEFVWCPMCGPNARIEGRGTSIGLSWVCLYCGARGSIYLDGSYAVSPPLMSDPIP